MPCPGFASGCASIAARWRTPSYAHADRARVIPTIVLPVDWRGGRAQAASLAMHVFGTEEPTSRVIAHPAPASLADGEEVLREAARLIARGWCQRGLAEDRHGRKVEPWSNDAVAWSPLGALTRIWYESRGRRFAAFDAAYWSLASSTGGRLEDWNTARWRTRWHVVNAFERARARLRELRLSENGS